MAKAFKLTTWIFIILIFRVDLFAMDIAIIVNSSGPLMTATDADIKEIYLGEKMFEEEIKISPLLYPEGDIKEIFLREIVDMTPKEYKLYWTRKVFQEGLLVPKTIANPADIITAVRENRGGIGFLRKEMIKNLAGVKIIKVIHK